MRKSIQRDLLLEIVNNSCDHLTASEIYEYAKKTISNISLGTVYRNINKLVDDNMIIRIKTNEGIDRFDNKKIKHNHFICDKCNKIIDMFDEVNINLNALNGNIINDYEINFRGICSDCK